MTFHTNRRLILCLAGGTGVTIVLLIMVGPLAFYANYGVPLAQQPNLMSELRTTATNLAVLGLHMLAGAFSQSWA
jgi:hypothetical protein